MALKDVLDGFDRLAESLREVNIGKSISEAQKQVESLQANQDLSEFDRIKAQKAIAQATGARVQQLGGNAFSAQQAMAALAPAPIDLQQSKLEATGEKTVVGAVGALEKKQKAEEFAKEQRQLKMDIQKIEAQGEESRKTAATKAAGKAKPIPKQIEKVLTDVELKTVGVRQMLTDLEQNPNLENFIGPIAGRVPGIAIPSEAVAFRRSAEEQFNEYRRIVTGAAASIPELKSLRPAVPVVTDRPEDFKAKAKDLLKYGELVRKTLIARGEKRGFDMEGFKGDLASFEAPAVEDQRQQAPQSIPGLTFTPKRK